jgi:hypothetical protein
MAFSSKDSSTPIIALGLVDLQKDAVSLVPVEAMIQRGAMVFELLGPAALVAVLNPYNKKLREEIAATLKRKCYFYLVAPSDFDTAVSKAKAIIRGARGGGREGTTPGF